MKQIADLTDEEVDHIVSIMLNKPVSNLIVARSDDKQFVIAEYKRERDIINSDRYDYIKMYITIDEKFQIKNRWGYINETPAKGCLGEGVTSEPLHNYQYIARYLEQQGYDIYPNDREEK